MTDPAAKARELMASIRYQVFTPEVTTMGNCAGKCGGTARGAAMCCDCLAAELDELLGSGRGSDYVDACIAQSEAERRVLQRAALADLAREGIAPIK